MAALQPKVRKVAALAKCGTRARRGWIALSPRTPQQRKLGLISELSNFGWFLKARRAVDVPHPEGYQSARASIPLL
jgi:hypothetical protein